MLERPFSFWWYMPYDTFRVGDEYCNYKVDSSGNRTGESLGCFDSEQAAEDQLIAIRIEENEEKTLYSSPPVDANLHVKEVGGRLRWIATYSNNIRDRDDPPEILSGESHRRAVYLTDKGLVPYPDLWVWHEKSWHIGSVDWLAVDQVDDVVFALASGTVKEEAEPFMRSIADKDVALSHGMIARYIERDDEDHTIITGYIDREITLLPRFAAANPLTALANSQPEQEKSKMAVKTEKREALQKAWPEASGPLSEIEELNKQTTQAAKDMELETKEEEEKEAEDVSAEAAGEEAREGGDVGEPEAVAEGETDSEKDTYDASVLRDEVVEFIGALNGRLEAIEGAVKELAASREGDADEISELREEIKEIARRDKQKSEAPMSATLAGLIQGKSALGQADTQVARGSELDKGPEETEDTGSKGLFFEEYFRS